MIISKVRAKFEVFFLLLKIRKLSDQRNYVHWPLSSWRAHNVHYFIIFVFLSVNVEIQLSFLSFFKAGNLCCSLFCLKGNKIPKLQTGVTVTWLRMKPLIIIHQKQHIIMNYMGERWKHWAFVVVCCADCKAPPLEVSCDLCFWAF